MTATRAHGSALIAGTPAVGGDASTEWIDGYVQRFRSGDGRERWGAFHALRGSFAADPAGSPLSHEAMLAGFRRELAPGGRLEFVAEAHLALAQVLADRGDSDGASAPLWRSLRLAGGRDERGPIPQVRYDRVRANEVNMRAVMIFGQMRDGYQVQARQIIARYFSATDAHREGRFRVHRAPPAHGESELSTRRVPSMGPPRAKVPVPDVLLRGRNAQRPDIAPPRFEEGRRPSGAMAGFELLTQLGQNIIAHQRMAAWAAYNTACERARIERDFLPAPPTPDEVIGFREDVERAARFGEPEQLERAQRILALIDFGLLEESSRAYWAVQ